jgi:hypothetical protein
MTALEQVNEYLRQLGWKLRLWSATRAFAVSALVALLLTLVLVSVCNRYQFAQSVVWPLRLLLFAVLASALAALLVLPLMRLTRRRVTHLVEDTIPGLEQRLLTATERPDPANPFTELVAEDVLRMTRETPADAIVSRRWIWSFAGAGALAAAILSWLIVAGPGYWGYGASLLWTGSARASQRPLYDVAVEPGNKTVRRKSEQVIKARLLGFSARKVTLHARYGSAAKWDEAVMQPSAASNEYQFLFPSVGDALEYYVQADSSQSKRFRISVKDLPAVKRVRVLIHFPGGLGLKDVSDDSSGDVRAVEGSTAEISVLTDRPLERGVLVLDKGQKFALARMETNWSKAILPIRQDGSYHVAAIDGDEAIRISDDYFIEAKKDEPPSVKIIRPGHDPRVSPIEEVPVAVEAADDFGVRSLDLHYSVNGGAEQVARFRSQGQKEEKGHTTLYLENFKLAPGDVISMYATAADANKTARSEILFAQAEAFDYKFSQSQQAGGMGAGGQGQDNDISERQKQIIAATFNEMRTEQRAKATVQERARFLSDVEGKLSAQAKTLAERMGNRELSQANPEFENFSKLMTFAASEMTDAVRDLSPAHWSQALVPEQKALQSLLRAEALFRDIRVAFGQGGSAGGGAQRELARMFDLELDTSKNQYETQQQSQSEAAADQQKAIDDAFERLRQLAQRQQELSQQRNEQRAAEQRWQEEQLRREAEELKRQLDQLAQNSQNAQQSGSQQNGSQASGGQGSMAGGRQSGQAGNSGQSAKQQSAQNREMTEAMRHASDSLSQAEEEMRRAVSSGDAAAQQRAAGQLAQAERNLSGALHRNAGSTLSDLTQQADNIASRQRDLANRIRQMYSPGNGGKGAGEFSTTLGGESGEMPEMNDPDNQRFGYGYRRRAWQQGMRPAHQPTNEESTLASDKEKLAAQLEQLQRNMQDQQRSLRATSPDASNKVQKALSDAEQKELALRMQKNAQWIREGYGDRNLGMEDNVTAGVEQLSRDLRGAQQALETSENGHNGQSEKTAQALSEVRQLREKLERAQNGQQGPRGNSQAGQSELGQGQQGQGQQSGNPQSGGTAQAGATGPAIANGSPNGELSARDLQQAIGQLSALRGQISGQDRALGNYLGGTLGYLRDLNADPRVLQATIGQDAVASLERLEAELTRRLGEQQAQGARSTSLETPSDKYRDAVAEYFKKLSQTQPK